VCSSKKEGVRFAQLWVNDRMVWEHDLTAPRKGKEWVSLDVTELAKGCRQLDLRFRVVNRRMARKFETIALLGPARLRAGPGAAAAE
jgi:hypothetical protein